ncbi:MAG: serine/threonine-protein kinase PknK, partial [Planctomycetota bacterium]
MNLEGRTVGRYRIGPQLGSGGMGTVHRAECLAEGPGVAPGTAVAVKFFHPHLVEEERSFRRFEQEAEIGMSIRHANVVRTFEISSDEVDGEPCHYMVMELIEGQTVRALLDELGTFPDHLVYQVADQTLDALGAVHERGVIHRDLKPENLVITREHKVLLMDLGIARQADRSTQLTEKGEFLGSILYAPPEQIFDQEKVGPRSDIYGVGASLYEMATGKRPFPATDLTSLLNLKLKGDVARPRTLNPDVDPFLDEVIFTCLQKEPTARFASCEELRTILREGERSAWWRERSGLRAAPIGDRALKRLRLPRQAPLVGREADLDVLREVYAEVAAGRSHTLFLRGPAGSGKSRLAYAFLEEILTARGPAAIAGRTVGSGGRSYQPFVEALHDLFGVEEMEAETRRADLERPLAELLPDTPGAVSPLADFLLGGLRTEPESGFAKDALVAGVANVLRRSADARPLVVVIEDLHLAGPETVELFGYLARSLGDHPVLLLGLLRDDEVAEGSDLQKMIVDASTRAQALTLTLEALAPAAAEQLVRGIVRHERTVRRLAPYVREKSDGNPLIILELLSHLRATGALVEAGDGLTLSVHVEELELPSTLKDVISLKMGRLEQEELETLEA